MGIDDMICDINLFTTAGNQLSFTNCLHTTTPDKLFITLAHHCKGYDIRLKGNSLEHGYKPDFVMKRKTIT